MFCKYAPGDIIDIPCIVKKIQITEKSTRYIVKVSKEIIECDPLYNSVEFEVTEEILQKLESNK